MTSKDWPLALGDMLLEKPEEALTTCGGFYMDGVTTAEAPRDLPFHPDNSYFWTSQASGTTRCRP